RPLTNPLPPLVLAASDELSGGCRPNRSITTPSPRAATALTCGARPGPSMVGLPRLFQCLLRRRQVGLQLQRLAIGGDCSLPFALGPQRVAQMDVSGGGARVERDGLTEAGDRLVQLALPEEGATQAGVGPAQPGVQFDGPAVTVRRLRNQALHFQGG